MHTKFLIKILDTYDIITLWNLGTAMYMRYNAGILIYTPYEHIAVHVPLVGKEDVQLMYRS